MDANVEVVLLEKSSTLPQLRLRGIHTTRSAVWRHIVCSDNLVDIELVEVFVCNEVVSSTYVAHYYCLELILFLVSLAIPLELTDPMRTVIPLLFVAGRVIYPFSLLLWTKLLRFEPQYL